MTCQLPSMKSVLDLLALAFTADASFFNAHFLRHSADYYAYSLL